MAHNDAVKLAIGEIIRVQRIIDANFRESDTPNTWHDQAHNALDAAFHTLLKTQVKETHYRLSAYAGPFGPSIYSEQNALDIAGEIANRERIPVSVLAEQDTVVAIVHPR